MTLSASQIKNTLTRLDQGMGKIEAATLITATLAMAINSIANVLGRYLFQQSLYFSDELNQFLIVIITFMGLGYITRQGKHIRMSAFYDMLAPRWQKMLMVLIAITTSIVLFILAWYALEYVLKIAKRGRVTPALQVPLYLTYIWVVVGLFIAALQYVLTAWKNLDSRDEAVYLSYTTVDEYQDPEIQQAIDNQKSHTAESSEAIKS